MPNSNSDNEIDDELYFIEHIPNRTHKKENLYFGLAIFLVVFIASCLLFFNHHSSTSVNRPPQQLLHVITQFQVGIDETALIAGVNNMQLPLSLEQLRDLEVEPYLSKAVTSPSIGCFFYENAKHQLRVTYEDTTQQWLIYWRINDEHYHDEHTNNDLCYGTKHWHAVANTPLKY